MARKKGNALAMFSPNWHAGRWVYCGLCIRPYVLPARLQAGNFLWNTAASFTVQFSNANNCTSCAWTTRVYNLQLMRNKTNYDQVRVRSQQEPSTWDHTVKNWVSIPWNILSHCLEHFLPRLFLRKTLHRIEDFILLNEAVSLYLFRQFKHKFTTVMNHILGTFSSAKYRILNLGVLK